MTKTEASKSAARYDVLEGIRWPQRLMQWATIEQLEAHLARTGYKVISERQVGLTLREVTIARATGSAA